MTARVLIVDDALSVRELVRSTLEPAGYEVLEAVDGKAALQMLEGEKLQLIITDYNMPNMNGVELVRRIRTGALHRFTPILMMTTERAEARKQEARDAGVRAWLTKPFTPTRLLEAVGKLAA